MPYTGELFEADGGELSLIVTGVAPNPNDVRPLWKNTVDRVLSDATLTRPPDGFMQTGGRSGRHSEHLGHLLAELRSLQRAYAEANGRAPRGKGRCSPPPGGGWWASIASGEG